MRRNRRRDSRAELALRSELHHRGLRFRVDFPIRLSERVVRPDVVFTRVRIAVFVDGCYWQPKFERNVARDQAVNRELAAAGWEVLRAWEHEPAGAVADRVKAAYAHAVSRL
jgi:DNA mismatch endonuclease (patch repair protein)